MPLSLDDARRIAADVLETHHPSLRVVGAASAEGGSNYTEIIVTVEGCHVEPCRVVIGVHRDMSETDFRADVSEQVRRHLPDRQATAPMDSDEQNGDNRTPLRRVEDLASALDDLSLTVDEIRENPDGIDQKKLVRIKRAIERATDVIDDIENEAAD